MGYTPINELIYLAENGLQVEDPWVVLFYLQAPEQVRKWLKTYNLVKSFNSPVERRRFGKFYSAWRIEQIALAIANDYNMSTCHLILVIIL